MVSDTPSSIPIIDFSKKELTPGTPEWESARSQVQKAIEEYGCFQALFDKISPELQSNFFASLEDFFDLPLDIKKLYGSKKAFLGYIGKSPSVQSYESFAIENPRVLENVEGFTNVPWPEGKSSFSTSIHSLAKEASALAEIVMRMIVEGMGVEKYLAEINNSTYNVIRVMKYEGSQTIEPSTALIPHVDRNVITILYQNQINGLQVQTKDGEWTNINFRPNLFTVIMGESITAWTNGRVHAPYHRVMMVGSEARYSIGTFTIFKEGYTVKTPEELVDEEHPLQYKPFDFHEFQKKQQESRKFQASIKEYYGAN